MRSRISRRAFLTAAGTASTALAIPGLARGFSVPRRPNIVLILVDDLGWADPACYCSPFHETPNIDRLAAEGVRFTDAYSASPVCSPTRAAIMTGKNPARLGIDNWIAANFPQHLFQHFVPSLRTGHPDDIGGKKPAHLKQPINEEYLPLEETTIAELMRDAGYATFFTGKWRLGDEDYYPDRQGFDVNLGGLKWGQPPSGYFSSYKIETLPDGPKGEYLTDRLNREAVDFIETHKDAPFFLMFSHYAVHTPLMGTEEIVKKYEEKSAALADKDRIKEIDGVTTRIVQSDPVYAAMLESVDRGVGMITEKLEELGLSENTWVIFTSDNGGLSTKTTVTSNEPLRYGKGWLFEGGIRVPLIIRGPGVKHPGSVVNDMAHSCDLFPTILQAAGLPLRPDLHIDGEGLMPLVAGTGILKRETLFWHFPHYHSDGHRPSGAIRHKDLKLIQFYENGRTRLYDLANDIGEHNDLSDTHPEEAQRLLAMLNVWRVDINARMPKKRGRQ
ncbi:MAG: sulfatase [Deltaproteobacteria bacterium]|uniref:Sulfatase n=1 Tax=Candidatus Zymogenus saltonus TaxID=2844893 RepID=A0A9D8K8Q5_9DELT|nr:sulfatase [Candidatus Zymogenus saltonus]